MAKATQRCPHDCSRCKAIEAGVSGRAITQAERIGIYGGLVEFKESARRVTWSPETLEAQRAVEVASIAYEEAQRVYGEILTGAGRQVGRIRDPLERLSEERRIIGALSVARNELEQAGEPLRNARRRHRELSERDSREHALAVHRAELAESEKRRQEEKKATRTGALALLRGRG